MPKMWNGRRLPAIYWFTQLPHIVEIGLKNCVGSRIMQSESLVSRDFVPDRRLAVPSRIGIYPTLDNLAHIPGKTSGNQARRISGIPFINCKQIEIMFVLFFHDPSLRNLPNHISCFDIINFNCERKRTFAPCAAIHKMINIPTYKNFGTLAASKSQCPVYLKWSGIWRKFQCLESSLSQPDLPNLPGKQIAESNCVIAQLLHHAQWNKHSTRFVI